jgi:hypothetical protein
VLQFPHIFLITSVTIDMIEHALDLQRRSTSTRHSCFRWSVGLCASWRRRQGGSLGGGRRRRRWRMDPASSGGRLGRTNSLGLLRHHTVRRCPDPGWRPRAAHHPIRSGSMHGWDTSAWKRWGCFGGNARDFGKTVCLRAGPSSSGGSSSRTLTLFDSARRGSGGPACTAPCAAAFAPKAGVRPRGPRPEKAPHGSLRLRTRDELALPLHR